MAHASVILPRMILPLLLAAVLAAATPARAFPVLAIDGPIGPVTAEYVSDGLGRAAQGGEPVVVLRVDTPGGLEASMRRIVQAMAASPVPVVAWVGPSGARAASAGLFVVAAAQVAAVAPGTNLGAAHPVALGASGEGDETLARKAEEDSAAFIRSLAEQRGRDPAWFEKAVRESASISGEEAVRIGVVDFVSRDLGELTGRLEGRRVTVGGREVVLRLGGAGPVETAPNLRQRILEVLSDPNIAYLLMILGFLGLFFELANPGAVLPGVVGGLSLILAFVGLQTLSFNYAGILLILLGLVLFLLEVKVTSYGLLTVGGLGSLVLGSLLLFRTPDAYERLSLGVVLPAAACTAFFFLFAVGKGVAAQRARPVSGAEGFAGERGRALEALEPGVEGRVFVHGESWNAVSREAVPEGAEVEVVSVEGLRVVVRRAGAEPAERRS